MRLACLALCVSVSLFSFAQSDFTVPAGTQRTLKPEERTLSLKTLSLGDNCVILIPPAMDGWTVTATDASIGANVKILGQGVNGPNGYNGGNGANAANCMNGMHGAGGSAGANGTPGKNVFLNLKIRKMGSLLVNVTGGNGGNGGHAGAGGKGGNATCTCNAGYGGNGGYGGRGGSGGMGGNVTISYSVFGNAAVSNSNFTILNSGGTKGTGGAGGGGGAGGAPIKCPDSKAAVRPEGASGATGMFGMTGIPGANGVATLQSK